MEIIKPDKQNAVSDMLNQGQNCNINRGAEDKTASYVLKDKTNMEAYDWGENCKSYILIEKPALSIKQEIMPPGTSERLHFHEKATQVFNIIEGEAICYVEEKRVIVNSSQSIIINPGQKHLIANESNKPLEFLIVSQPSTKEDRINIETIQ